MPNPKEIKNLKYSKHALLRMGERGITKNRILRAIKLGDVRFLRNKWRVDHLELIVYFNKTGIAVTTVFIRSDSNRPLK